MTKMTRRTAMLAVPAVGATLLSFPSSTKADHDTSTVDALIEAHHSAWQHFEDRCSDMDDLETSYRATHQRPMTPMAIAPDGRLMRGYLEVDTRYPEEAAEAIKKEHAQMMDVLCGPVARRMAPEATAALEVALRSSRRRSLLKLRVAIRRELEQQEAFGLVAARAEYDEMSSAEENTLKALLCYVPKNPAEAKRKADYVNSYRKRGYSLTDDQVDALMSSVSEQFAA